MITASTRFIAALSLALVVVLLGNITETRGAPAEFYATFATAASSAVESSSPAEVEVLLSFPLVTGTSGTAVAVSVDYHVTGGSATNGTDYTLADGTLGFTVTSASQTISIPVADDTDVEGDETVTLTIDPLEFQCPPSAACGGVAAGFSTVPFPAITEHTFTILDNDVRRCSGVIATIVGSDASETITGTPGDDVIVGLGGDDTINGLGGNDRICGRNGADTLNGGDGNDTIFGGDGNDIVDGGPGNDTIRSYAGNDISRGGDGDDRIFGSLEDDAISGGAGDDELYGRAGADNISGNSGDDTVTGGAGDDTLNGGDDADEVRGGAGVDHVNGNDGADSLVGGPGSPDSCAGGAGTDTLPPGNGCEEKSGIP